MEKFDVKIEAKLRQAIASKGHTPAKVQEIIKSIYKSEMPLDLALAVMTDVRFIWFFKDGEVYFDIADRVYQ